MEKRRDRKGRLQTIGRRITGPAWRFLAGTLAALILMGSAVRANGQRPVYAEAADERKEEKSSTTSQLYAQSAVLMDAENGRVLLQKNGNDVMPMASTTKIMTCILTLELGNVPIWRPSLLMRRDSRKCAHGGEKGRGLSDR